MAWSFGFSWFWSAFAAGRPVELTTHVTLAQLQRHDALGGLIHEYELVAP